VRSSIRLSSHSLLSPNCVGLQLIAPDIVLTAAHCAESFSEVQVGRHDRDDDSEKYESFIVEHIITHPSYFRNHFLDPDPHDFAIVKVFGQSRIGQPVKINSDPYVPKPNQQMAVVGWGSIDPVNMNVQSEVLLETDAYYIPNDECKTFVGSFRDYVIDFEQVVINVTMCAMNFEDLSDSCRGDSGGPLIIKGVSAEDDLLVGLVSAG
jgi:secreted trypsin-like serine protease